MPMNFPVKNILRQYFNTHSLEETAVEDIERLADEYPYHTVVQFLLARKYRQLQHGDFNGQAAKATVYFNNPYWLNLLLRDDTGEASDTLPGLSSENPEVAHHTPEEAKTADEASAGQLAGTTGRSAADDLIATLQENLRAAAGQHVNTEQIAHENGIAAPVTEPAAEKTDVSEALSEPAETILTDETIPVPEEQTTESAAEPATEEISVTEPSPETMEPIVADETVSATEEIHGVEQQPVEQPAKPVTWETGIGEPISETADTTIAEEIVTTQEELPKVEQQSAELPTEPVTEPITEETGIAEPISGTADTTIAEEIITTQEELPKVEQQPAELPTEPVAEPIIIEEAGIEEPLAETAEPTHSYTEEGTGADEGEIDATPEAPTGTMGTLEGRTKLSDIWKQPVDPNENIIPVEPLHTVDYFASQGIKLSQIENAGQDKLSLKLKSFTEWLKTMKRIHPEKLETSPEQVQTVIQHIAENSNKSKEVLTEAIAEVFARQGLKHKAIDVYEKLSLQNPDKSAYFAAKISKLNES